MDGHTSEFLLVQKNALNQSIKQVRHERDDLFANNQKLKQEKLAAEVSVVASHEMHFYAFVHRQRKVPVRFTSRY